MEIDDYYEVARLSFLYMDRLRTHPHGKVGVAIIGEPTLYIDKTTRPLRHPRPG
jgi:hypothetical protein